MGNVSSNKSENNFNPNLNKIDSLPVMTNVNSQENTIVPKEKDSNPPLLYNLINSNSNEISPYELGKRISKNLNENQKENNKDDNISSSHNQKTHNNNETGSNGLRGPSINKIMFEKSKSDEIEKEKENKPLEE